MKAANEPTKKAMRDKRFVAVHRGGPLDLEHHRLLVIWAADCAERVLHIFEEDSSDDRPRQAIELARAWARGEVSTGAAQKAAFAAHAAARQGKTPQAIFAARTAGHAVATAHFADHSMVAANFSRKTIDKAGGSSPDEYFYQISSLPEPIRKLVISGIERRFPEAGFLEMAHSAFPTK